MSKQYDKELSIKDLAAVPDDQIDTSDIPELGDDFWKNAKVVEPEGTEQVTLRVKKSVLQTYRAAGQRLSNAHECRPGILCPQLAEVS